MGTKRVAGGGGEEEEERRRYIAHKSHSAGFILHFFMRVFSVCKVTDELIRYNIDH